MIKVKWEDYKKALVHLESIPTLYDNSFPYNCLGGRNQNGYFFKTGDCWNGVVKAPLWTSLEACYDKLTSSTEVQAKHYKPTSDLGDWNGATILAHCYDRSTDMANIEEGEFLYLVYNGGSHAGVYVGEVNGKRKVCEFTSIWENGCHFSDIADDGTRSYKGVKYAKWLEHGKMPWVEYPVKEEPLPITEPEEDITLVEVEGDSDDNMSVWQRLLIDILYAIAKAIDKVFKKEDE